MKQAASKGVTKKHAGTAKHTATKKHAPTAKKKTATTTHKTAKATATAKSPTTPKARKLAQADVPVREVITPFASRGRVDGASAWDSLADVSCCSVLAVAESLRLSGCFIEPSDVLDLYKHLADGPDAGATLSATLEAAYRWGLAGVQPVSFAPVDLDDPAALLLGLELPGPHAVCAENGRWWSWRQPWPPSAFPDAVIEEAWAVTWP